MPFHHQQDQENNQSQQQKELGFGQQPQQLPHHPQQQQHHTPYLQQQTSNALVQAAHTLSSIGTPSSSSGGGGSQQHGNMSQQQHHSQQQLNAPMNPHMSSGAYSPSKQQQQQQQQQQGGGGYNQSRNQYDQMEPVKKRMSFRGQEDSGIQIQPTMNQQQMQQPPQQTHYEYSSAPPLQIQNPPPQQQQPQQQYQQPQQPQQQPQQQTPQQQQQYQAYHSGSGASRSQAQSTSSLQRTGTGPFSTGEPSSKYLPIQPHLTSQSTSNLPPHLPPPKATGTSPASSGSDNRLYQGSGIGMSDYELPSHPSPQVTIKEQSRGSQYNFLWPAYAVDWCKWPIYGSSAAAGYAGQSGAGRVAIGSHSEDGHNYISILNAKPYTAAPSQHFPRGEPSLQMQKFAEATLTYPVTRILWEPPTQSKPLTDLLATSGDHLRLWSLPNTAPAAIVTNSITNRPSPSDMPAKKLSQLALLSNSKSTDFSAPLTSLDWNPISPSLIITSSIDTTCTIWDIPTLTAKTQLIAHDKEVFDVRFMSGSVDVFASCGADGSVRLFDLRSLDHSTIIYEPTVKEPSTPRADQSMTSPGGPNSIGGTGGPGSTLQGPPPLLRLSASPHEAHLLATFSDQSNVVRILDVRQPGQALVELRGHTGNINCIEWCPYRRGLLAGGGDDSLILLWDLLNDASQGNAPRHRDDRTQNPNAEPHWRNPVSTWRCDYEVNNLSWAPSLGTGMSSIGSGADGGKGMGEWLGTCAGRNFCAVRV